MSDVTDKTALPASLERIANTFRAASGPLPERVLEQVRDQQDRTERLIGWVQLTVVTIFAVLYTVAPKPSAAHETFQPVPYVLAAYFAFTLLRLALAHRARLPGWFLYLSIVIDMALLFVLIWSFHLQYEQPPAFYLKAPTLLYVFIFISLRALRFEVRFVVAAGLAAAGGWLALLGYAVQYYTPDAQITRDYVEYMTSNAILLGAEFDKVISILMVTAILAVAIMRARALLIMSVAEGTAARDLSRFFSPEVARKIVAAEDMGVGVGEARDAAIVNLDLRGFTKLAETHPPDTMMRLLADYQNEMVPIIRQHGGSIDKFLGDGIMATFGVSQEADCYAADALRCVDDVLSAAAQWSERLAAEGRPGPPVNAAVAAGRVIFGAVGERDRLEYTVIGEAVNLSAKIEKHNAVTGTRALAACTAYDLARAQGYRPSREMPVLERVEIPGVGHPVDLVVLG